MKNRKHIGMGITASIILLILILDAKTALLGAQAGIELCYKTVVPSLFPFIVISIVISSSLIGIDLPVLRPIGKVCGMPTGSETLLLLGLLGGYPVGAQSICNAYKSKTINKKDALRLLGFCNNAGPAFIFGMISSLFQRSVVPWVLWGIHILSAIIVGFVLPDKSTSNCQLVHRTSVTIPQALEKGIKTTGVICGWIIIFRVIIAFLQRWFLWMLPAWMQICFISVLELANGCCDMYSFACLGTRFILCSGMLAFGGVCILMQTSSVTEDLGWGMYFPGKILQTVISILLAALSQRFLFPRDEQCQVGLQHYTVLLLAGAVAVIAIRSRKKVVAFLSHMLYNNRKYCKID